MKGGSCFFLSNKISLKNTGELYQNASFIQRTDVYEGSPLISRNHAEQGSWEALFSFSIKSMLFLLVAVKLIIMPIFLINGRIQGAARLPATPKAKPCLDLSVAGAKSLHKNKIPTTMWDLSFSDNSPLHTLNVLFVGFFSHNSFSSSWWEGFWAKIVLLFWHASRRLGLLVLTLLTAGAEERVIPDTPQTLGEMVHLTDMLIFPPVILKSAWTTSLEGWGTYVWCDSSKQRTSAWT